MPDIKLSVRDYGVARGIRPFHGRPRVAVHSSIGDNFVTGIKDRPFYHPVHLTWTIWVTLRLHVGKGLLSPTVAGTEQ